jgi:hypothetical protein
MVDKKITALDAITALTDDDLLVAINDPGGSPVTKKITWANVKNSISVNFNNDCYNPQFRVAQRGAGPFISTSLYPNSDDRYLLDGWVLLSDGNDIVDVSQSTTVVPTGVYSAIKLEVETANKQFGKLYILEAKDSAKYIGGVMSVQFKARMAAADDNTHSLKCVVLSWSSTADAVTSDVVDTWAATITPAANWTAENAASSNTLTTTYQTFEVENVSIDTASTTNVAVFIYCDQTNGAVDDVVYITDVKIEPGASCTPFAARPLQEEIFLCHRTFQKSYPLANAPGSALSGVPWKLAISTSILTGFDFVGEMRDTPAVVIYSENGTAGKVSNTVGADIGGTFTMLAIGPKYVRQITDSGTAFTAAAVYTYHWTASAEL